MPKLFLKLFDRFICFLPCSSMIKNLPANAGDMGSIPGLGRFSGEGNGNPLQYSCLGNPIDRGASQAIQSMGSQRVGHDLATKEQHRARYCQGIYRYLSASSHSPETANLAEEKKTVLKIGHTQRMFKKQLISCHGMGIKQNLKDKSDFN